nr:MAG TPA: hypothetical protein [Caudoviricetes sp.]
MVLVRVSNQQVFRITFFYCKLKYLGYAKI